MKIINSEDIQYNKPILNEYIGIYNDKLASILANNFSMKYLSSATINRLEAQTKFYEFLEKYIQINELLDSDKEINIHINKEDQKLYCILKKKYGQRVTGSGDYYFLKLKILFLPKIIRLFFINLIFSIISRSKCKTEEKYTYIVRTYFDYRSIDKNGYLIDQYFGDLIDDLKINGKLLVVYKTLRIRDIFTLLKTKSCGFDAAILEYFLSGSSILSAFKSFSCSHITIKEKFVYKDHDCTEILQLFVNEDYLTFKGLGVFIEKEIAVKLFNLNPENILFPYENQTWEKIYPYVKNIFKFDTKITGYQHTGVSYKLLNYFPSIKEKYLPMFPDKIITVGKIIKDLLMEQANYPSEIFVGGALRFKKHFINKISSNIEIIYPDKKINKQIVYAFSYDIDKYNSIINLLISIFGNTEIKVLLKFHPDYIEEDILKLFQIRLPENFIAAGAVNWNEIYPIVDLVLYDDNSIAFEGMMHGVKTFSVAETEKIYDITRKFYFNGWKENLNKNDLIYIKNQLIDGTFKKEFDLENIQTYINQCFTKYNSKEHYAKFL